jgi:hypothetical protein
MVTLDDVIALFPYANKTPNGFNVECPLHDDQIGSMSVALQQNKQGFDQIFFHCQAGCTNTKTGFNALLKILGYSADDLLDPAQVALKKKSNGTNGSNGHAKYADLLDDITAVYDYRDEAGNLLYQCVKYDTQAQKAKGRKPAKCRMRKPGASPGYFKWNLDSVRLVLYRLRELLASNPAEPVLIVEGEKDVETARAAGFIATCNPTGAGSWQDEYSDYLKGRTCLIIPDNDDAGESHIKDVHLSLLKSDPTTKAYILRLPGVSKKGEDLTDWLNDGHTADELKQLIEDELNQLAQAANVPPAQPPNNAPTQPANNPQPQPAKPVIDISIDDLEFLNSECWNAISLMNDPPVLFTYGSSIIRIRYDCEDRSILLDPATPDVMRHQLSKMADWRKANNIVTKPPMFLVKDVLASDSIPLPRLNRTVTVPVFAPDGTLQTQPGYSKASGVIYAPPSGYQSLPVPDTVTKLDVDVAKDLIDELLQDFPFASNADRCNAIALFLLPFVRDMIDGPTPLHLIEASMPGSGKGLLASSLLYAGLGKIAGAPQPRDDDELRKFITSELIAMRPVIFLDNISRTIDSGAFAAALTLETWNDRVLGTSATANVKIRSLWLATANNATLSTEITRRTVRIRLTPNTDKPEERENFLHEDLIVWVMENRPKLVQAAHIICRWAIQQSLPRPKRKNIGSFERWTRLMASIMETAGYSDFLGNYRALQDGSDTERAALSFFAISAYEWMQKEKKDWATNAELLAIASPIDGLEFRGKDDHAREMSFGRWIKSKNEVITEYLTDDDDLIEIYRLKIISGIAGKGTNRGKSVSKIELVETVARK